ncbi:ABRA family protein [Megaselia abdita]
MTDVSHELGSLRHIVDTSLSSKVAMFNKQANQHKENQLLNPFSGETGRRSPKPSFSKDEYGKPLAGSLTEARGQKANIHVIREMLELCQIIDSEGYVVKDEPSMRVIPFGELFNIYNYISDKVVGICLRARKHKLIEFEGEMLFQRRDDDVPIFLLKPIKEIRQILDEKTDEIKRGASPAPQATSILMDKRSRSASPSVGKIGLKREETAKVPEIKENTKEVDDISKKERKVEVLTTSVSTPIIEVHDEKEEIINIDKENTPDKVVSNENNKETLIKKHSEEFESQLQAEETQPQEPKSVNSPLIKEEKPLPPAILVQDVDNKDVPSEETSSATEVSKNIETTLNMQEQPELISASSSVFEIIEEIVTVEKIADENNNTSKNEEINDNPV